jgi:TatD DNase family protein
MRYIIDSHVHIEGFTHIESILNEAREVGVDAVICVGGDIESSKKSVEAAQLFPDFFYPAIGVHPSNILNVDLVTAEEFLLENISNCVALGEVGLDYAYGFAKSRDVRIKMKIYLERFLEIASEARVPVSVHSRSAYNDTLDLVIDSGVDAVFHWYDGPIHILHRLIDSGFYVSATPAIEYSKGVRAAMHEAPLERILVETDSPVYLRNLGRESKPVDVVRVVNVLANLKDIDRSEVVRITTRNTESLFGI